MTSNGPPVEDGWEASDTRSKKGEGRVLNRKSISPFEWGDTDLQHGDWHSSMSLGVFAQCISPLGVSGSRVDINVTSCTSPHKVYMG